MLVVLESARSLSLWALITDVTGKGVDIDRQRADELAALEHENRMNALRRAGQPEPVPEPVAAPPVDIPEPLAAKEPEPEPIQNEPVSEPELVPEPPTLETPRDVNQAARKGGKNSQHERAAAKVEKLIVLGNWEARDADALAARRAAQ